MTPTKIVKKGKSKKAVSAVGGELERRRDWTERVGEDFTYRLRGSNRGTKKIKIEIATGS